MIHILINAAYSVNSNNFQAVFRRCITTEIRVETQTNLCISVMYYVSVRQVTLRVFGLSFALSFLSCCALIHSSVSDAIIN